MVMSEMSLCRIEQCLLGIAPELRPALAVGNPAVLLLGHRHASPLTRQV